MYDDKPPHVPILKSLSRLSFCYNIIITSKIDGRRQSDQLQATSTTLLVTKLGPEPHNALQMNLVIQLFNYIYK